MGVKGEKVKQGCWCFSGARALAPVKATRNDHMFDEVSAFAKRLTSCSKQIAALKKATDGLVQISDKILSSPMPRVWEIDPATNEPVVVPGTGNALLPPGQLQRSNSRELKHQVLDPIDTWQGDFNRMKARMTELHNAGLRLDSARRAHYNATQKHIKEHIRRADDVHADPPSEDSDPKLVASRTQYAKIEQEVHQELTQLINNAHAVHTYLTSAMALQANTLGNASRVQSPGASPMGSPLSSKHGTPIGTPMASQHGTAVPSALHSTAVPQAAM